MKKRRTAEEVARLLRDAERDLAKGLTISGFRRKQGIAETTYYRRRPRNDPGQVDSDRRCRELESEVGELETLVAELLLDKQMLQDIAKKVVSPDQQRAAADYPSEQHKSSQRRIARVMGRSRSVLRYRRGRQVDEQPLSREIKRLARRHPPRDEFLERVEFEDVADARAKASWHRREYNAIRPHGSLSYATPNEFSAARDGGKVPGPTVE